MFKIDSNQDKNTIYLQGNLTFSSAREAEKLGNNIIIECQDANISKINIDLSEVKSVDSSLLAILLSWIKRANIKNTQLRFINIPQKVESLIKLNDLDTIFNTYV